jgi:chloramphenicol-sensitive protein RarD
VVLAVAAVAVLTVESGGLPWVSLVLAFSFATYGYLRKTLPIGPAQGFFLEVAILTPLALVLVLWFATWGSGVFGATGWPDVWLLLLAGPVTAVPLLFYAFGAKLLRISTIGMMQYIGPTIVTLLAVFAFNEPFGTDHALSFGLIWVALGLYSYSLLRRPQAAIATSGQ